MAFVYLHDVVQIFIKYHNSHPGNHLFWLIPLQWLINALNIKYNTDDITEATLNSVNFLDIKLGFGLYGEDMVCIHFFLCAKI